MIAAEIFRPGQWTDFFLLVGTGAVTLTGLVFVAMSLNLKVIAVDATHRFRAINTLTGLALVFMRCALVLMGAQDHRSIGAELFVVAGISAAVFVRGYANAIRMGNGYDSLASWVEVSYTWSRCLVRRFLLRSPRRSLYRGDRHRHQHVLHDYGRVAPRHGRLDRRTTSHSVVSGPTLSTRSRLVLRERGMRRLGDVRPESDVRLDPRIKAVLACSQRQKPADAEES